MWGQERLRWKRKKFAVGGGGSLERKGAGMSTAHPPKYRRLYRLPVQDRRSRIPPFPNANTHAGKLQVPGSSQVVLGPESSLETALSHPIRGEVKSDAEGASVGPASLGRRVRGAREPTSALWAHPWASTSRVSQPGGLAGEPQVGSAGARRPLEAVLSKADARPFCLPSPALGRLPV